MIIEKTMDTSWLSNTWLVADAQGGHGVIVDTGGPMQPILDLVDRHRLTITHVLCTHHHGDHTAHNDDYSRRFGCPVVGHASERDLFGHLDQEVGDGEILTSGSLRIQALHIPGHTLGQLAFLVNDAHVFTGDTLFRRSVGGTRAPGHTTCEDIRHSIMERLMKLPPETTVHPGHTDPTTIGDEWEHNPFVRVWRGVDTAGEERCTAFGRPATLLLSADDYDGGQKCWIRFDEGDKLDIVPGSQVRRGN
jgi:glyoxylase-like metal-dependent hydrolase (beta-lactamase superfamily II)